MSKSLEVTYYYHSGFSCAMGDILCIFDYWRGERGELPENRQITPEYLANFREIYVFISHSHPDHVDQEVFTWHQEAPVSYIVSYEMPVGTRGRRVNPGDQVILSDRVSVKVYDSTDLGVSFMVTMDGVRVFHAGDLNFWHWRDESTPQEIVDAEDDFHRAVAPLEKADPIDLAFFPVDPRQGRLFDAGANYFIMAVKPRLMIPMHFFNHIEVPTEFARRSRCRDTEVMAMTRPGEKLRLDFADDGFMTINILSMQDSAARSSEQGRDVDLQSYEHDPFVDTDLPVRMEGDEEDHEIE